jgi:hypothetical protein
MAINLNDNIRTVSPKPLDNRYGPYTSIDLVDIPQTERYIGLTVGIIIDGSVVEYWYETDVNTLVEKKSNSNNSITSLSAGAGINIDLTTDPYVPEISIDSTVQITDNISTDIPTDAASDTYYPSVKATKTYVDGLVVGLLNDRGNYDASGNTYPADGGSGVGGGILKGDIWFISVAGTLGGTAVTVGSSVRALQNNPGQTPSKWDILDVGLGFTPENVDNKVTTKQQVIDNATSTDKYPSLNALTTYISSLNSGATTSNITANIAVGGIASNYTVPLGTTLQQFAELLLITTYYPTFVAPSFSLSNNAGGPLETGSRVSFTLTFTFSRGQIKGDLSSGIWDPNLVQNPRAGASSSYTIDGTTQSGNTLAKTSYLVLNGSNTFSGTVTYLIGPQPKDSKGANYNSQYPAGTSASQSTSFTGLYPYYYYKRSSPITAADMQAAILAGTATKVVGSSTGTLTLPYAPNGEYISVAYPASSTAKTFYYVTDLDKGLLTSPTSPFDLGTLLPCTSSLGYWSTISYRIHISPILTNPNPEIQLRNS